MPLPRFVEFDAASDANKWIGMPTAVYRVDVEGMLALREENADEFAAARDDVLRWLYHYQGEHDAWVATPERFAFAASGSSSSGSSSGSDIGNRLMPIKYVMMDQETSTRCMLTCTDGAPYREQRHVSPCGEWTAFANEEFYYQQKEERISENAVHRVLLMMMTEATVGMPGPVVFSC